MRKEIAGMAQRHGQVCLGLTVRAEPRGVLRGGGREP